MQKLRRCPMPPKPATATWWNWRWGGNRWAEEALYRKHVNPVSAFCLRLLRHREDAEDAIQETFVQAFRDLPKLREPTKFKSWLMQIAVNRTHKLFRRRKRYQLFSSKQVEDTVPLQSMATDTATQEHRMELTLLDAAFNQMSSSQRICWTLRFFEGYQITEISEITRLSRTTVKRRLAKAVEFVEQHIGEGAHE